MLSENEILSLAKSYDMPSDYLGFIRGYDQKYMDNEFNYIVFWQIQEIKQFNDECESQEYIPDYFIIGTDGGGCAYAINKKTHEVYLTELVSMSEEDIFKVANNFTEFLERFEREEIEIY